MPTTDIDEPSLWFCRPCPFSHLRFKVRVQPVLRPPFLDRALQLFRQRARPHVSADRERGPGTAMPPAPARALAVDCAFSCLFRDGKLLRSQASRVCAD